MKTCAIVILNYNGEQVLKTFLPSVVKCSHYDIWVIDNASSDTSLEVIKQIAAEISVIKLQANFGFTGGYNLGLEQLRGLYSYFILLNSDVEVTAGWDTTLITFLDNHPDYSCVQPKILSWQDRLTFDYAGAGGGFLDSLGYPYCRGRIWNHLEQDHGQYDDSISVDWASGACMAIRSGDFYDQNGFDAHFFAHMEEIDLCWRLRRAGKKIGYVGEASVFHRGGATLDRASSKKLYLNIRNSLSMVKKNLGLPTFTLVFLCKILLEGLACFGYILSKKWLFARSIRDGYFDFFKTYYLYPSPSKGPHQATIGSGPIRFLLFQVMIMGRRRFSDL